MCGRIGKVAALLPHCVLLELPTVALTQCPMTKHNRRDVAGPDGKAGRLEDSVDVRPAAAPARKRPLSSLDASAVSADNLLGASAENTLSACTENSLPERKRRSLEGQRLSPHSSAWW